MDDKKLMEIIQKQNDLIEGLSEKVLTIADWTTQDRRVIDLIGDLLNLFTKVIDGIEVADDRAIRTDMAKLRCEFVAFQQMFADREFSPKPIPGKPPDLSLLKGGLKDDDKGGTD